MRNPLLVGAAGIMLIVAQLMVWGGLSLFQLPGLKNEVAATIKVRLPEKIIPLVLSHYPELEAMTYQSSVNYCAYRENLDMDFESEGITDDYVCGVIEQGLVQNTEELRHYLARKVVSQKVDEYTLRYGPEISRIADAWIPLALIGMVLAFFAFAIIYFGTTTIPKGIFYYSLMSGMWGMGFVVLSVLCFFLVPWLIEGQAENYVRGEFELAVLRSALPYVQSSIEGLFLLNALVFGGGAFLFSFVAAISYIMTRSSE
ncbi:hypothetical protein GF415_02550 [Candidatus Micrarchaeota archaeon]|nr:hypothetical protein [Candidatus Micrarchaeota archaeon]